MKLILLAAAAAALAAPAAAQGSLPDVPILAGATAAPDCGNLYGLAGKAFCVSAPLAGIGGLADAYVADLEGRGWIAAGGDDNRVVFVKRREGGGCDGLQMQAFYDTSRPAGPEATGYLGFGVIPGDVCAGQPGAEAAPQQ
ncbi:hypothetical protein [Brevundimonas sp.]|uniref:hypothetical protein n=1 Tax=Brevundimonas sp. TaxID=1871086 RepID=UPI002D6D1FD2|nr:hypothetical protein [Brevundimonas sp.]HYD26401.1 hypothetical protein [Brevundimonas sp.]